MHEVVRDRSTNVLHFRGTDRLDGSPTAACNKRYNVTVTTNYPDFSIYGCGACQKKAAK